MNGHGVRIVVDGRHAETVGFIDVSVGWYLDERQLPECLAYADPIVVIDDLVRHHDDAAVVLILRDCDRSAGDIDGARRGLDDDDRDVDGCRGEAGEGTDACFEVGDDGDALSGDGAEQLLGGKTASRSTGLGVLDAGDHRQTHTVRRVRAISIQDVAPGDRMLAITLIDAVTEGQETLGLEISDAERKPEVGVGVTVECHDRVT